jgi:hypothetical protein
MYPADADPAVFGELSTMKLGLNEIASSLAAAQNVTILSLKIRVVRAWC